MKTMSVEFKTKAFSIMFGTLWVSLIVLIFAFNNEALAQDLDPRDVLNQLVEARIQAALEATDTEVVQPGTGLIVDFSEVSIELRAPADSLQSLDEANETIGAVIVEGSSGS